MDMRRLWSLAAAAFLVLPAQSEPPPASGAAPPVSGTALLRTWVPPDYPPDALKEKAGGMATIRLVVDRSGRVSSARIVDADDPRLGAAALAAAKKWVFTPALDNGVPVACSLDAPVLFSPAEAALKRKPGMLPPPDQTPQPSPRTDAKANEQYEAEYPDSLLSRKFSGVVQFECQVTKEGMPARMRILAASHVDFVIPALQSLERWRFTPAMQGDLPIEADLVGEITFDSQERDPAAVLAANQITDPDGKPPALHPSLLFFADPVTPYGPLVKGEAGSATVLFTVDSAGRTSEVTVQAASSPEFGRALAAAVETLAFSGPMDEDKEATLPLRVHVDFPALPSPVPDDAGPVARVVAAVRANRIGSPKGLDEPLTPVYRIAPAYPQVLLKSGRPPGRAEIEFVIDRDGRARLPNIIACTDEAFGWSAATAVAQWVFRPPLRKGQPVDVRVRIPFEFKAPAP